eukprot:g3849.t1
MLGAGGKDFLHVTHVLRVFLGAGTAMELDTAITLVQLPALGRLTGPVEAMQDCAGEDRMGVFRGAWGKSAWSNPRRASLEPTEKLHVRHALSGEFTNPSDHTAHPTAQRTNGAGRWFKGQNAVEDEVFVVRNPTPERAPSMRWALLLQLLASLPNGQAEEHCSLLQAKTAAAALQYHASPSLNDFFAEIVVPSNPQQLALRSAVRQGWGRYLNETGHCPRCNSNRTVKLLFGVGPLPEWMKNQSTGEREKDLAVLPIVADENLIAYALENYRFALLLKADTDSFIFMDRVLRTLEQKSLFEQQDLYAGGLIRRVKPIEPGQKRDAYPQRRGGGGFGYFLSPSLCRYIATHKTSPMLPELTALANEDWGWRWVERKAWPRVLRDLHTLHRVRIRVIGSMDIGAGAASRGVFARFQEYHRLPRQEGTFLNLVNSTPDAAELYCVAWDEKVQELSGPQRTHVPGRYRLPVNEVLKRTLLARAKEFWGPENPEQLTTLLVEQGPTCRSSGWLPIYVLELVENKLTSIASAIEQESLSTSAVLEVKKAIGEALGLQLQRTAHPDLNVAVMSQEQQQEWAGTLAGAAEEEPSEGIARKDAAEVLQKLHDTCWEHLHGQRLSECLSLWREVFALNCLLRSTGSETAREALRLLDLGLILGGPETHVAETLGLVVKRPVEEVKDLGMEDFLVIYFNKKRPVALVQGRLLVPWSSRSALCPGGEPWRDYWMEEGFEIMQLKDFIQHCKAEASERSTSQASAVERLSKGGYLAQHALLDQLPSLEADVQTPDFALCGSTGTVLRQVFFGPNGTVTPVHWDPYENIFCQVVGEKYLRLYPPSEAPKLYPRTSSDQERIPAAFGVDE